MLSRVNNANLRGNFVLQIVIVEAMLALGAAGQLAGSGGGTGEPRLAQSEDRKYELSGTVVNSVTGEGIPRALVQINGMRQAAVLTDADGHFHLEGLSRASARVIVRKPGYFSEQEIPGRPIAPRASLVDIGPGTQPLTLKLVPAAIVTGRITGSDSEPIETMVRLFVKQSVNGRKFWQQAGTAMSGEDGHYRIGNLRPGQYLISVNAPQGEDFASLTAKQQRGYPLEWFYPGVPERNAAGVIEVAPRQEFQADVSLPEQNVYRISGTVVQPPEVMGSWIHLLTGDVDPAPIGARMQAGGRFRISQVPAGSYVLQAGGTDQLSRQYYARIPISVRSNVDGIVVAISPLPTVPVVVKAEFTRPQLRTSQPADQRPPSVYVQLLSVDPPYSRIPSQAGGPENQGIQVANVPPGRYRVELSQPYGYVRAATCGSTDLLQDSLVITSHGQMPPIEVTLRDDVGSLAVNFNGTLPEGGAQVLVLADDAPTQAPRIGYVSPPRAQASNGVTDSVGGLNMNTGLQWQDMAPGNYRVVAFDSLDGLEYGNPEVMQKYSSHMAHATIHSGGKTAVSVDVIKLGD